MGISWMVALPAHRQDAQCVGLRTLTHEALAYRDRVALKVPNAVEQPLMAAEDPTTLLDLHGPLLVWPLPASRALERQASQHYDSIATMRLEPEHRHHHKVRVTPTPNYYESQWHPP